jgi:enterochelin esterase-like enzyme
MIVALSLFILLVLTERNCAAQAQNTKSQGIQGVWQATINAGAINLKLVVKLSQATDGTFFGRMDSPDQGAMDIPLDSVTFKDGSLHFEIIENNITYEGTLSKDGSEITGQFIQGGAMPLSFKRAPAPLNSLALAPMTMQKQPFQSVLAALQKDLKAGDRNALETFWQKVAQEGTPLVEAIAGDHQHALLTFLWRGRAETKNVVVSSELGLDPVKNQMTHVPDTDIWYKSYRVPNNIRLTYELSPNDSLLPWNKRPETEHYEADPLNPRKLPGFGSAVELPAAPLQPWITTYPDAPLGKVEQHPFKSKVLNNERGLWVYTPPGYSAKGKPYGLLLLFDGPEYIYIIPTATILDNLLAKNLTPPLVLVNVGAISEEMRDQELGCNQSFEDFLIKELLPWIHEHYNVTPEPAQTIIGGISLGGFSATYQAMRHPEIFGNVISQSAPFWFKQGCGTEDEWMTKQFASRTRLPIRFYLEVGSLEGEAEPESYGLSQITVNEHLRDALRAKGYTVFYQESAGGHNPLNWRGGIADGLLALFGKDKAVGGK